MQKIRKTLQTQPTLGMRGKALQGGLSDGNHIPLREAFRWSADLEAPASAIWYKSGQRWWTGRANRSDDGVSLEEEARRPDSLFNWYRALLALRRDRSELRRGDQQLLCPESAELLCLLRSEGERRTLLIVNLGKDDARATAPIGADWIDLIGGKPAADTASLLLRPLEVRIFGTR